MPKRTVYLLANGRQAVEDDKHGWWVRYRVRGTLTAWVPYAGLGSPLPKGMPMGKLIRVVLPIDRSK